VNVTRPNNTKMVQVGMIYIRGFGLEKHDDLCNELEAHQMNIVGVTETALELWNVWRLGMMWRK
jgi:hypothetical protein